MDMSEFSEYRTGLYLWKIVSPFLIVIGTVGNSLSIVILTKRGIGYSSTTIFFTCLAVSDILALNVGLLRQWIRYTFDTDIRALSEPGCKLHLYVVYLVTQYSSWMLVCVTTERFISTWFPLNYKTLCSLKSALISVSVILVALLGLNAHFLVGYGNASTTTNNQTLVEQCVPLGAGYEEFALHQWTWIDLCVFCLIPLTILMIGNTAIIGRIVDSHRKSHSRVDGASNAQAQTDRRRRISGLTATLLVVSLVFVLCVLPICIYPIGEPAWKENASAHDLARLFLFETLANLLMYVNHSINFMLYFLSGSKFREDAKKIMFKCWPRTDNTVNHKTSTNMTTA